METKIPLGLTGRPIVDTLPGNKVRIVGEKEKVRAEAEKFFRFGWLITPGRTIVEEGRVILFLHQPDDYKERIEERKRKFSERWKGY